MAFLFPENMVRVSGGGPGSGSGAWLEVFFNVWPFARYGLLFLMLTALGGKKATARRGESSRSSAISEEAYYESI
ncbi:hypothetical protein JZ751_010800 [Albula glossodonta]|uniref:Uncharacterized protein n=1 Tax=Albula glossodonta TaxID=121402 RepID=A0A8T2NAT9_9TELE|nr:hypothetical protein JZ751_010800 [Albula glossodonta]